MELLEISSKSVRTEISVYTGDANGSLKYGGTEYLEGKDPACFELADDTFYFEIKDVETIVTTDGKKYVGGYEKGLNVYMGEAISVEERKLRYPAPFDPFHYSLIAGYGATRFAVREDGRLSPMFNNGITFAEYCEQYKMSQDRQEKTPQLIKVNPVTQASAE